MSLSLPNTALGPPRSAEALLEAMAERDLLAHSVAVCALSAAVCRRLGEHKHTTHVVATAALMHDVGKLAVPADILDRPGRLSDRSWKLLRDHAVLGERMLMDLPGLEATAELVRHSHERVDGLGYPDALVGTEIPLGSRIIAACDAWDAMTSDRSYRPALRWDDALDGLIAAAGTQLDTDVVAALVGHLTTRNLPRRFRAREGLT